jgi:hypothetical protein
MTLLNEILDGSTSVGLKGLIIVGGILKLNSR